VKFTLSQSTQLPQNFLHKQPTRIRPEPLEVTGDPTPQQLQQPHSTAPHTILSDTPYGGMLCLSNSPHDLATHVHFQPAPMQATKARSTAQFTQYKTSEKGVPQAGAVQVVLDVLPRDAVLSLCLRQHTAGGFKAVAGLHKCGARATKLCRLLQKLESKGPPQTFYLQLHHLLGAWKFSKHQLAAR
jgi:hypothetical protein